jgi:hypothetical protein
MADGPKKEKKAKAPKAPKTEAPKEKVRISNDLK